MRIGLLLGAGGGGIERYVVELAAAMLQRRDVEVVPIGSNDRIERFLQRVGQDGLRHGAIPIENRGQLAEALTVRHRLGKPVSSARLDLLHCTKHIVPARSGVPRVLTAYDLMVLNRPQEFAWKKRALLPFWYRRSLLEAEGIIADSDVVAEQIRRGFPSTAERVWGVPLAVPQATLNGSRDAIAQLAGVRFGLAVGDFSPRKNLPFLMNIWPRVHAETGLVLAVAGSGGRDGEKVSQALDVLAAQGIAARLGRVSDSELRWLYAQAEICCVPSLEEGYGLPVAEALAMGCPVLANTDPALIEAGCGESVHVPVSDADGWESAIRVMAGRKGQAPGGSTRRTWDDVASETVACYEHVLGRKAERTVSGLAA